MVMVANVVRTQSKSHIDAGASITEMGSETNSRLLMYSLDVCVKYCTYLPIFKSQKVSVEALNFLVIISS